jgi:hypothetical protein
MQNQPNQPKARGQSLTYAEALEIARGLRAFSVAYSLETDPRLLIDEITQQKLKAISSTMAMLG